MEKNAWAVVSEVQRRIDGAPVFSEFIHAFVTETEDNGLFVNKKYLKQY